MTTSYLNSTLGAGLKNTLYRGRALSAIALTAIAFAVPISAEAQEEETSENQEAEAVLGTVTVTARKREENILDVPASVTSLSSEDLQGLVFDDSEDLLRQIPGAGLLASGPEALVGFSIRGQGQARNGFSESATGLFRDGIYVAGGGFGGRALSRMDYFDVQRVEVLRGPQGALYGRNAIGGSVNAITARPNFDGVNGYVRGEYSAEIERYDVQGVVNLPLTDSFAVRVGAYSYDQSEGFHYNPRLDSFPDRRAFSGARVSALYAPSDAFNLTAVIERAYDQAPAFANIGYNPAEDPDEYTHPLSHESFSEIEETFGYLIAEGETSWGNWRGSVAITDRFGERANEDLDHFLGLQDLVIAGTEVVLFATQDEQYDSQSADFYIASNSDQQFTWLFGAEYIAYESDYDTFNFGTTAGLFGLRAAVRGDLAFEELTSYAAYAAFGYEVNDKVDLGFEVRAQQDDKDFEFDRVRNQPDSLSAEFDADVSDSWTSVTPTFTIDYSLSDQDTLYGRIATGTRPGGFNAQIPGNFPNAEELLTYDPEYAISGELGWKGVRGPWSLAAAAYYIQTEDLQVVSAASDTLSAFIIRNVPDGHVYGIEIEGSGTVEVGPGNLFTSFGLSANDGEYGDGSEIFFLGTLTDISGLRIPKTNDINANVTLSYSMPVTQDFNGFATVSGQFERGGPGNAANTFNNPEFDFFDARIGVRNDKYSVSIFGKNLTDERFLFAALSPVEYWGDGRIWGVSLRANF